MTPRTIDVTPRDPARPGSTDHRHMGGHHGTTAEGARGGDPVLTAAGGGAVPCANTPAQGARQASAATPDSQPEAVDHPGHYGGADNPYEVIKVIEAWGLGFHLGNTVKYVARCGRKAGNTELQELRKARWYLDRKIAQLEVGVDMARGPDRQVEVHLEVEVEVDVERLVEALALGGT